MAGREYCASCQYPMPACICKAIRPANFASKIVILQHPSEQQKAKNTARLISLIAPKVEIAVGETEQDFKCLKERLKSDSAAVLVFPALESQPIGEIAALKKVETIVLLDGTWRKAKKIWHSNPWLRSMPIGRLEPTSPSLYRIRKGREVGGYSTLEAAALTIEAVEGADVSSLYDALEAMQANWRG